MAFKVMVMQGLEVGYEASCLSQKFCMISQKEFKTVKSCWNSVSFLASSAGSDGVLHTGLDRPLELHILQRFFNTLIGVQ